MKPTFEIDTREVEKKLKNYRISSDTECKKVRDITALKMIATAKRRLSGELGSKKHWVTGRLINSLHPEDSTNTNYSYNDYDGQSFDGALGVPVGDDETLVGTNVEYAGEIEFGRGAKTIVPVRAKALAWKGKDGKMIFRKKVTLPPLKGDSFLYYAMKRHTKSFLKALKQILIKK